LTPSSRWIVFSYLGFGGHRSATHLGIAFCRERAEWTCINRRAPTWHHWPNQHRMEHIYGGADDSGVLCRGLVEPNIRRRRAGTSTRSLFFIGAAASLLLSCYALLRPKDVCAQQEDLGRPVTKVARFWRHRPIYPALLIWLLWNFSPGSVTALQYHLQNALKGADWQWGEWNALFTASFIPTYIIFGLLCRHVTLRSLLWWGTVAAIPQYVPLIFVNSVRTATLAAIPAGLMGGVATAAYLDLIIRSAPRGLQGTTLMAASAIYFGATRFGDILGSYLYDYVGGFSVCVMATTFCYASILPVILTVQVRLINSKDGEFDSRRDVDP
jgi:hypothetical protein